MKKIRLLVYSCFILLGCDPSSIMEAYIENNTTEQITLRFDSSIIESKTLVISSGEEVLFQEGFSATGGLVEPFLMDYDSIYVKNSSDEIIKLWKLESTQNQIYQIDNWQKTEPDKRFYRYLFSIE